MWRIVLYLVAVLAMALLCIFVVEQHGVVSLSLGSHVYEASLAVVILGVVASAAALYLALRFALFVLRLPVAALPCLARVAKPGGAAISKGPWPSPRGISMPPRATATAERFAGHEPLALLGSRRRRLSSPAIASGEGRLAPWPDFRYGARARPARPLRRGAAPRPPQEAHRHAAQAAGLDVFLPWRMRRP